MYHRNNSRTTDVFYSDNKSHTLTYQNAGRNYLAAPKSYQKMPLDYLNTSYNPNTSGFLTPDKSPISGQTSPYLTLAPYNMISPESAGNHQEMSQATVDATIEAAEAAAALNSGLASLKRRKKQLQHQAQTKNATQYPCDQCDKVFHRPFNLRSHLKSHSSEKPFACKHCGRKFTRSHDRKRHELLHDGLKKYKCGGVLKNGLTRWGCNKTFARADALGRHFRTETGWLCVKPLMVEAQNEEQGMPTIHQDRQMLQETRQSREYLNNHRSLYTGINFNNFDDPTSTNELVVNDILKNVK